LSLIGAFGLLLLLASKPASADVSWRSPLTLGEPTEIPGTVLEPGKYMVKVLNTKETRMVVQFLNADESKVFATVMAIPNYRVQSKGEGEFMYFQRAEGLPQALKTWFYPANTFGVEFVYPKAEAVKIAQTRHEEVYAAETAKPETKEEIVTVTPELKEVPVKEAPIEQPKVAETLPKTGSALPLLALAGLAAIATGAALRVFAPRG
jgi:LPXTG-motif cell wall-anchored protein